MNANQLMNKIENSSPVEFGVILNKSIDLFKKVWLQGFIHLLISMIIVVPLILVLYIPIMALVGIEGVQESYGEYPNPFEELSIGLVVLFVILAIIVSIIASAFQFGVMAHFYRVCRQVDRGKPETSNYFMFFKGRYLKKIITVSIAIFGISLLAMLLCVIPLFYVLVPLQILGAVFAFNADISTSDLVKASFKFGNKIWLTAFLLIFISGLLAELVGLIMCFVGFFFTASFVYLPIYYMYKDGIGFDDDSGLEKNIDSVQ
ncbi:hypothetical protein AB832_02835 [Flavobacteriaceae bacterium (ex Bugula neritina AB1)]|nr:hypothetical protein AB832_02835 [Flavobacteriaceae bacterium (ex Bugula neritina AB1)]